MDIRQQQEKQLFDCIRTASDTAFGQQHRFAELDRYEDFKKEVPVSFYSDIRQQIKQLKEGTTDLLWPGPINQFAVSAGTSGKGKHLPLSDQRLSSDRRFMRKIALSYLRQRPNVFNIIGKHISLPGLLEHKDNFRIGEISAFSATHAPRWLTPLQFFDTDESTTIPFSEKLDRILQEAVDTDVRVMTAAPNWVLTIFQKLMEKTGANSITDIWPNLQLLICGGVKLDNYRPHIQTLLGSDEVDFIETYGASEGYLAFSDNLNRNDLKLVFDNGIFYEFIPNPLPDQDAMSIQETVPLWEVRPGIPYAVLVTTNAGLWRYALNDIVEFTETHSPRIEVMGRVSEMLDDYGEALYAYEAEEALQEVADQFQVTVGNFTVGAQMADAHGIPRHFWFVQASPSLDDKTLADFSEKLDAAIQQKNRHYAIRRGSNTLGQPEIRIIDQQQINSWLQQKGKEKAQGKLPSILRDDQDIDFFKR